MPVTGPCAAACSHSEEECSTCLASQYMGGYAQEKQAVEGAYSKGFLSLLDRNLVRAALDAADEIWQGAMKKKSAPGTETQGGAFA